MGLSFVLDTSAYSFFLRDQYGLEEYISRDSHIYIPVIVLGELRGGFAVGTKLAQNTGLLDEFLDEPNTFVFEITNATAQCYAKIYSQLRGRGKTIGTNDMWIAALCLEHELPLLTLDKDFSQIDNLDILPVNQ